MLTPWVLFSQLLCKAEITHSFPEAKKKLSICLFMINGSHVHQLPRNMNSLINGTFQNWKERAKFWQTASHWAILRMLPLISFLGTASTLGSSLGLHKTPRSSCKLSRVIFRLSLAFAPTVWADTCLQDEPCCVLQCWCFHSHTTFPVPSRHSECRQLVVLCVLLCEPAGDGQ